MKRKPIVSQVIDLQYISDADGNPVSVIVPIEVWREIESERETVYLLKSEAMKQRLLEAKERTEGLSIEEARVKLNSASSRVVTFAD